MKIPSGSGVPPRCGAAVTSHAAAARPAPSRRDAAPTGSLRDFCGKRDATSKPCISPELMAAALVQASSTVRGGSIEKLGFAETANQRLFSLVLGGQHGHALYKCGGLLV